MERLRQVGAAVRQTVDRYAARLQFDPFVPPNEFVQTLPPKEQARLTALTTVIQDIGLGFPGGVSIMGDVAGSAGINLTLAGRERALTFTERIRVQTAVRTECKNSGWEFTERDTRTDYVQIPRFTSMTMGTLSLDEPIPIEIETPSFNLPTAKDRSIYILVSNETTAKVVNAHTSSRTPLAMLV